MGRPLRPTPIVDSMKKRCRLYPSLDWEVHAAAFARRDNTLASDKLLSPLSGPNAKPGGKPAGGRPVGKPGSAKFERYMKVFLKRLGAWKRREAWREAFQRSATKIQ